MMSAYFSTPLVLVMSCYGLSSCKPTPTPTGSVPKHSTSSATVETSLPALPALPASPQGLKNQQTAQILAQRPEQTLDSKTIAFEGVSSRDIAKLIKKKELDIRTLGATLPQILDRFQQHYDHCTAQGIASTPFLSKSVIQQIKDIGPEALGDNLFQAPLDQEQNSPTEEESDNKKKSGLKLGFYNDRVNWGVFNILAGAAPILGAVAMSTKADDAASATRSSTSEAGTKTKSSMFKDPIMIKKISKYGTLAVGAAMMGSGLVMLLSGINRDGFNLTEDNTTGGLEQDPCPANNQLRQELFELHQTVTSLKMELSALRVQQQLR